VLKPVYLLDYFDGNQDGVIRKIQQRVWIVQENVGIKDIILHIPSASSSLGDKGDGS
jgi:hypothetical protein